MDHARTPLLDLGQNDADKARSEAFDWLGRPQDGRELGGRRSFFFSWGTSCLEGLAFFGLYFNLVLFLRTILHQSNAAAASTATNWLASALLFSLVGAFVAESYFGRLWTCLVFLLFCWTGLALVTLSAHILTTAGMSSGSLGFFYFSLYLTAFGYGSAAAPARSLGADQLHTVEDKSMFFSGYLVAQNVGLAFASTLVVYLASSRGWIYAFCLCTAAMALGLLVFLLGLPVYKQYRNTENPFYRALQVLVAAARKWSIEVPPDHNMLHEISERDSAGQRGCNISHTRSLRLLDKAATITEYDKVDGSLSDRWRLCTVTQVEELKCLCRLAPIGLTTLFFFTMNVQSGTTFVEQGAVMNQRIGSVTVHPATMNLFTIGTIVVFPTVYKWVVAPAVRKVARLERPLVPLERMGLGYVVTMGAVGIAAAMEAERRRAARGKEVSSMSILWLVPQYVLMGGGQFLVMAGASEFFYSEAPGSMRSVGTACCIICEAVGTYISSIIVTIVAKVTTHGGQTPGWIPTSNLNEGHLDYFFLLLLALALINFVLFVMCARHFHLQTRAQTSRTS